MQLLEQMVVLVVAQQTKFKPLALVTQVDIHQQKGITEALHNQALHILEAVVVVQVALVQQEVLLAAMAA
jgi:hypothetical protein